MKAKQELLDYLISNINEKNLLSQIKRLNLDRILLDEIKSIDLNEYNTIHKMMILQKLHNHIILNEINKIIKISDNFNIKVIQLKGIFLAAELYNPIEIRKTSDIDILVKNDQIGRFLDVIGSLGYTWRYNKKDRPKQVSKEMINIFYCSYDNNEFLNYHVEFKKNINYFGRDLEIVLEVHTTPLNRKKQYNQYINKKGSSDMLVERAEKKYLLGYNVWILELHDKLIHLMYHFVRHYIHDLRSFFSFSCSISPKLNLLHDIVLIIDNNNLNWDLILERSVTMSICGEILLALKFLDKIYPSRIPKKIFNDMKDNWKPKVGDFYDNILPILINYELNNLIFNDYISVMKDIMALLRKNAEVIDCPFIVRDIHNIDNIDYHLGNNLVIINEFNDNIKNSTGTYVSRGLKPYSYLDCSANVYFWWDDIFIYFHFRIYDDKLVFKNINDEVNVECDKIEITLDLSLCTYYQSLMKLFYIIPCKNKNDIFIKIYDDQLKQIINETNYIYKISIDKEGYKVTFGFKWSYLNILPSLGMEIPFNMAVWDFDDVEKSEIPTRLSLYGDFICSEGLIILK